MPPVLKRNSSEVVVDLEGEGEAKKKSPRKVGDSAAGGKQRGSSSVSSGTRQQQSAKNRLASDEVMELLETVAELSLETQRDSREIKRYSERTVLIPAGCPMATMRLEEAKQYNLVTKKHRGNNFWPAYVKIAAAALRGLSTMEEAVADKELRPALEAFWKEVVLAKSSEEIAHEVQVLRLAKPKIPAQASKDKLKG
eukprot:TRINITY_DN51906_c0_g1_i1.p1 TRINITY_DN51906_c0_g1~~TRINITY_DN51906_c0_g1_i1.p1  ORF type:complete len:197 (+),score=63.46 TRINITY_DN51906_c0_g1_i1:3-593(+)